jgi:glycolate oxidase FAD binding subunit
LPSVSEPGTVEEAAAVLAEAAGSRRRVSIDRDGGDVVLSTRSLDRVLEHQAGDLTATVEAGVRLSALNERLRDAGQMLALDPPGDPTIGACLAGDLSGPRRHRYGAPRDLVLGVTVVLADGTVASAGGKVVKNVAGYDLGKLFCGSRGRYGLIARVSLRLHPLSQAKRSLVTDIRTAEEAFRLAQAVHGSSLVPSAVDLLWRAPAARLAILFEGSEPAVLSQVAAATTLLGAVEADDSIWAESRAWQACLHGRISFPPRGLVRTLEALEEALIRPGVGSAYVERGLGDELEGGARRLADRIALALDPEGAFAR